MAPHYPHWRGRASAPGWTEETNYLENKKKFFLSNLVLSVFTHIYLVPQTYYNYPRQSPVAIWRHSVVSGAHSVRVLGSLHWLVTFIVWIFY